MAVTFDAATMSEALDRLARVAVERGLKRDVAVYGGSRFVREAPRARRSSSSFFVI